MNMMAHFTRDLESAGSPREQRVVPTPSRQDWVTFALKVRTPNAWPAQYQVVPAGNLVASHLLSSRRSELRLRNDVEGGVPLVNPFIRGFHVEYVLKHTRKGPTFSDESPRKAIGTPQSAPFGEAGWARRLGRKAFRPELEMLCSGAEHMGTRLTA